MASGRCSPRFFVQSARASVVAGSPIMDMQGSPGRMRIAKKTMLMAPNSMGTATRRRRSAYWTTSVEDLQHLRVVVAVVQREFPVVRGERGADPLGVARPLPRQVADGQADQVALHALLGLGVDRRPLLH